jgi:hypothetical protein
MNEQEFIEKIKEIDPILHDDLIDLDTLYEHILTTVREFERLEDLEDTTVELKAYIEKLQEQNKTLQADLYSANQVINELIDTGEHIPHIY